MVTARWGPAVMWMLLYETHQYVAFPQQIVHQITIQLRKGQIALSHEEITKIFPWTTTSTWLNYGVRSVAVLIIPNKVAQQLTRVRPRPRRRHTSGAPSPGAVPQVFFWSSRRRPGEFRCPKKRKSHADCIWLFYKSSVWEAIWSNDLAYVCCILSCFINFPGS